MHHLKEKPQTEIIRLKVPRAKKQEMKVKNKQHDDSKKGMKETKLGD